IENVQQQTAMETFPAMIVALSSGRIDGYVSEMPGAVSAAASHPDLAYVVFDEGKGFVCDPADTTIAVGVQKGSPLLAQVNEALATLDNEAREQLMADAIAGQPLSE
ncbi:MAG: ABC transporter substrate-binding protein, partial [Clostridiales bacterium]|nr:ABC transporter substrate-binding protein [Clostridiales bacterium]